ncbi:hypothetical protein [Phenylobacterium sp. SCN 70-31]|uniref:hypothetical protein n=1 Tax=Phenylobacterium sp. SCN 70-31 TaxID=1660129 RepID=UPI00086D28B8|nr:hypothetical protein [Phenylobacterium sp. SCN 70-31]ODT86574.1 MAG: hypothetical protein ABS78_15840 [Phenylobacterium sp. SCN 70-31]
MATFDLPDLPEPRVSPALLVGAVSPLWSYFGAVAAGGVAYWWMTRLARPVNLEALFAAADTLAAPVEAALEPAVELVEAAAEAVETMCEAATGALVPATAVGGEAAPMSPLAVAQPPPEAELDAPAAPPSEPVALAVVPEAATEVLPAESAPPKSVLPKSVLPEPVLPEPVLPESALIVSPEPAPVVEAADTASEPTLKPVRTRAKKAAAPDEPGAGEA